MGTIATKLTYLADTKQLFKDRLNSLGAGITESTTFRNYLTWLDEFYGNVSDKTDIAENGIVGETSQETTTGKNKFDNTITKTNQGNANVITDTTISTGKRLTYTYNSTTNTQFLVYALMDLTNYVGKTIRFKANFTPNSSNKGGYLIGLCNSNGNNRTTKDATSISGTTIGFVVPELTGEQTYLSLNLYANTESGTVNQNDYIDYTDMVLTIDDADMTYELFTGGNPAPNPDYSMPIINRSGELSYKVSGKNLYSGSDVLVSRFTYLIPCKIGDTFTLSFKAKSTSTDRIFLNVYEDIEHTTSASDSNAIRVTTTLENYSITTTSTINGYLFLATSTGINSYTFENIMLEKGNQATPYEPYIEPRTFPVSLKSENLFLDDYLTTSSTNINAKLEAGTYTMSLENNEIFDKTIIIKLYDTNGNIITTSGHLTTNGDVGYGMDEYEYYVSPPSYNRRAIRITLDNAYNLNIGEYNATGTRKLILVSGSVVKPYYDIELSEIGDYQDFIKASTGKNLFDINGTYYVRRPDYTNVQINGNNLSITNTYSSTNGWVWYNIPVKVGKQITISYRDMVEQSSTSNNSLRYLFSNTTYTEYQEAFPNNGVVIDKTNKYITTTTTEQYLILLFRTGNGTNGYTISDLQVEYSGSQTSYEPYGKGFYLTKNIGKVVLNGSEADWTGNSTASDGTLVNRFAITGYLRNATNICICNYFTSKTNSGYANVTYGKCCFRYTASDQIEQLYFGSNMLLNDLKTWLSTHNTTVYYVLATPTYTEITEEDYPTLYSQLKAIQDYLVQYKISNEFILGYDSPEIEY